jgi:hypothetical protein
MFPESTAMKSSMYSKPRDIPPEDEPQPRDGSWCKLIWFSLLFVQILIDQ